MPSTHFLTKHFFSYVGMQNSTYIARLDLKYGKIVQFRKCTSSTMHETFWKN